MDARRGRIAAQSAACRIRVNGAPTFTLAFHTFFCIYMCVQKVVMVLGNLSRGHFGKLLDNETTRQNRSGDWKLFFCFYFNKKAIESYIFLASLHSVLYVDQCRIFYNSPLVMIRKLQTRSADHTFSTFGAHTKKRKEKL